MKIHELLIEDGVVDTWVARMARSFHDGVNQRIVDRDEIRRINATDASQNHLARLLIARQRGPFIKLCPGYQGSNCCAYFILHLANGCPYGCTYCALGAVINSPLITVYANLDNLERELDERVFSASSRIRRIGTGQFSDSLGIDDSTDLSSYLVTMFAGRRKGFLELKSKSASVEHLLGLTHGGRSIVSFSLSLPEIVATDEAGTSGIMDRLAAAARVQQAGYRVGLHFDPLIAVDDWRKKYEGLVDAVAGRLNLSAVVWVSLGTLRLDPSLRYSMRMSNPVTRLDLAELHRGYDGRYRYAPDLRTEMYRHLAALLTRAGLPVYLCMEAPRYWKSVLRWRPDRPTDVKFLLDELAESRWPSPRYRATASRAVPQI